MFGKKSQNLKNFLLERELSSWNRSDILIMILDLPLERNIIASEEAIDVAVEWPGVQFSDPKIWKNDQNGNSQKWSQIGRSYFLGRDRATFKF